MESKIVCSALTNRIFLGKTKGNKFVGEKTDVTNMAIDAVATFLLEGNSYVEFEYEGMKCKLKKTPI